MSDWSSQPDEGGEGEAMTTGERLGVLCFCFLLACALLMLAVTIGDITIPMP